MLVLIYLYDLTPEDRHILAVLPLLETICIEQQFVAPPALFEPLDGPKSPRRANRQWEVCGEKEYAFGITDPSCRQTDKDANAEANSWNDGAPLRNRSHCFRGKTEPSQSWCRGILPPVLA